MADKKIPKEKGQKADKTYDKELMNILNKIVFERGLIANEVFTQAKNRIEKLS